jgi:hypothetical protein
MRPTRSTIEVIPHAGRLVESLRDLGYDFVQAVADLVDNSIAAAATRVDVTIHLGAEGDCPWVRIVDNGKGMDGTTITEAMRYGASAREFDVDDLGKFGLGLKTASMSQCRRFTVASRVDPGRARIEARQFDLDHIRTSNSWRVIRLGPDDRARYTHLVEPLRAQTGTVVLWEELDRTINFRDARGDRVRRRLLELADRLAFHLGMVFHRFIKGEARLYRGRRRLELRVNETPVESWDPFATDEACTVKDLERQAFELHTDKGKGTVYFKPYILPPEKKFSSKAAHERAAGPRKWNQQQGLYIYRADRMIQSGGWSWLRAADEHTKLARAALDFTPDLDGAFEINVNKTRVKLSAELREQIKGPVQALVNAAQQIYRRREPATTPPRRSSANTTAVTTGRGGPGTVAVVADGPTTGRPAQRRELVEDVMPPVPRLRSALEEAARQVNLSRELTQIAQALAQGAPDVARELGW